ncbi:hypothetical protein B9K03_11720, partial [Rothia sp. Olga]
MLGKLLGTGAKNIVPQEKSTKPKETKTLIPIDQPINGLPEYLKVVEKEPLTRDQEKKYVEMLNYFSDEALLIPNTEHAFKH